MHRQARGPLTPRRRHASGLLAAAAIVALAGCGTSAGGEEPTDAAGAETQGSGTATAITVGVIPIIDVAPIYLGVDQGFFADEGLDVTLETAQGGAAIVPAVVSGQYQFGFSNATSLLLATSSGLALQGVTAGVSTTGEDGADFGAVVVPGDSDITSAADLAGKRVAVNTLNNINTTTINKAVDDAGGDASTIEYVELAFPDIPAAVASGDVDAGQVVEPFLTSAQDQGMKQVVSNYVATDPDLTISLYFTSDDYAAQDPEVVDAFARAMTTSLEYADSHPDEVRSTLGEYMKIDEAVAQAVTLPRWPSAIDEDSIALLADLAVHDGLLESAPDLGDLLP